MKKLEIVVSACLMGHPCRYDGGHKGNAEVIRYVAGKDVLAVCPEQLAGLPTPREPAQFEGGGAAHVAEGKARIVDSAGRDQTTTYWAGAVRAWAEAQKAGVREAIVKENSPSCGVHTIFCNGQRVQGEGLFTFLLKKSGVAVKSEVDVAALLHTGREMECPNCDARLSWGPSSEKGGKGIPLGKEVPCAGDIVRCPKCGEEFEIE